MQIFPSPRFYLPLWMIVLAGLGLIGCCVKDPSVKGDTSLIPGNFWQPKEDIMRCPCNYAWDQDLKDALASIQKENVQVADLIDVALLMNPTTQATWANARAAAYGVGIAESALYPNIVLNDQLTYEDTEYDDGPPVVTAAMATKPTAIKTKGNRTGTGTTPKATAPIDSALIVGNTAQSIGTSRTLVHDLSMSYLLLDFGGRAASIEAAKQALYQSNWIHNRQIQQVIISVLQAYYQYTGIAHLLQARYSDLENAKKNYEAAKVQFEMGTRNKLDVLQAETNLINIELSIVQLTGQKEVLHGTLANAMGLPANTPFQVPDVVHLDATDVIAGQVDQMVEQAIKDRPDLAAAYATHAQRKAEVIVARSQGLPKLGSLVELQEFNDMIHGSLNTHSISGSLMVSAPIFSGYLYVNQEKQAQELVRQACANIRTIEMNITLQVVTSYFDFKTAIKSVRYSEDFLKYSQEAYDGALIGYQVGTSSILDLLAAQQSLSEARARLIQARTQWAIALSNISFAMGTTGTAEEMKPWKMKR